MRYSPTVRLRRLEERRGISDRTITIRLNCHERNGWYIHVMNRRSILIALLGLTGVYSAGQSPAPKINVILHQSLGPACAVRQPAEIVNHGKYASVVLQSGEEIFSPELTREDRLVTGPDLDKSVLKLARKSGFRVEPVKGDLDASSQVISKDNNTQCPTIAEALSTAARDRQQRKREIQSKLHHPGMDGVMPPTPIVSPQPHQDQQGSQTGSTPHRSTLEKAKYQGNIRLAAVVGTDGSVPQVKVVRAVSSDLDNKAIEAVKTWKFSPATKDGLPVPVLINIEFNFRLH